MELIVYAGPAVEEEDGPGAPVGILPVYEQGQAEGRRHGVGCNGGKNNPRRQAQLNAERATRESELNVGTGAPVVNRATVQLASVQRLHSGRDLRTQTGGRQQLVDLVHRTERIRSRTPFRVCPVAMSFRRSKISSTSGVLWRKRPSFHGRKRPTCARCRTVGRRSRWNKETQEGTSSSRPPLQPSSTITY